MRSRKQDRESHSKGRRRGSGPAPLPTSSPAHYNATSAPPPSFPKPKDKVIRIGTLSDKPMENAMAFEMICDDLVPG